MRWVQLVGRAVKPWSLAQTFIKSRMLFVDLTSHEWWDRSHFKSWVSWRRKTVHYCATRCLKSKGWLELFIFLPLEGLVTDVVTTGVVPISPFFHQVVSFCRRNGLSMFLLPTLLARTAIRNIDITILVVWLSWLERIGAFRRQQVVDLTAHNSSLLHQCLLFAGIHLLDSYWLKFPGAMSASKSLSHFLTLFFV